MKARSLIFDLFGDYPRSLGGEVRLRDLSSLMSCFGIPETTVRVLVTRLRKEGWLSSRREGRETIYSLTDATWRLLDEGRGRIFNRASGPWDGEWHMIIYSVPESERALREQLRKKLAWFGFGPFSSATWLSPHDRTAQVLDAFSDQPSVRLDVFRSRSEGLDADRSIAARAWDLAALDDSYVDYVRACRSRLTAYRAGEPRGIEAFVERMHVLHRYRSFPFRDPDLPPELLPADWHGRRAHEVFLEVHGLLRAEAEAYVDALAEAGSTNDRAAG